MGQYARNHIASACYLRPWAGEDGNLCRVWVDSPAESASELKRPKRVGWRHRFFQDRDLAHRAERRFSIFERRGRNALDRLEDDWPIRDERARTDIASLIAIHMIRNPAFVATTMRMIGREIDRKLPAYRETLTEDQLWDFLRTLSSEAFRVEHMLDLIPKHASLVASMHWSLVEFPLPLLATSDQPVTVVPLLNEDATAKVTATPSTGYLATEEIRVAIDSRHALLLTWIDDEDPSAATSAADGVATELNRAVIAQADREWFHHPDRRPTRLSPEDFAEQVCRPIGSLVHPLYSAAYAAQSPRRAFASDLVNGMIQKNVRNAFHVASVRREAA